MNDYLTDDDNLTTIWLSGISAAGKTTLGARLYQDLQKSGIDNITFLDGEEVRRSLKKDYGHSIEDRFALLEDILELILSIKAKGNHVIIGTISHKKKMRDIARARLSPFMEVWLECPVDICHKRDYKGNYDKALAGKLNTFAGVTEPYEKSAAPELVLHTGVLTIEITAAKLHAAALNFINEKIIGMN
ncbi:MAG: adenylyl-sulfate kinase [Rhodospirillales bacterium]|nr:adenylyl-sulfate kinase [Rhodospirillales bacterium]